MLNFKSKSNCVWQEERDFVFCQTDCEGSSVSLKSLKNGLKQKFTDMSEFIIDVFEEFIITVKEKSAKLSCNEFSYEMEMNIEDHLDLILESGKEYLASVKEKSKMKFSDNKNIIIDGFEELVEKIKEMGHFTCDSLQTVYFWKEKTVDSFENLIEQINNKIVSLEQKLHFLINEKRNGIIDEFDNMFCQLKDNISQIQWDFHSRKNEMVDEFEDIVKSTKWAMEDKKRTWGEGAVNTFDDILEFVDEVIEEGKEEVEAELVSIKYALWFSEKLLTDFVQYCEQFTTEFVKSSEKQVICLLHEGKKKAKGIISISYVGYNKLGSEKNEYSLEQLLLFYTEVVDSLVRGYEDKLLCDNLVLEINSSRYAYNVSMSEVNFHVMRALLTLPRPDGNLWQQLVSRLSYFTPILTNYIRSTAAQRDCLLAIEDVAGSHPEIFEVLVKIIHWLYEQDVLSEDSIVHWYNNPCSEPNLPNAKRVRTQVAPFIKWLKEAEEQSSDDDDEDDDD